MLFPAKEQLMDNESLLTTEYSLVSKVVLLASSQLNVIWKSSAALAICIFLMAPARAQERTLVDGIDIAKKTVAPIVCLVRDAVSGTQQDRFRIVGTAFMEDAKGTFITAWHVVADFVNAGPWKSACTTAITFPIGGWKRDPEAQIKWFQFDATACQVNQGLDVAVCRTTEDLSKVTAIHYEVPTISISKPLDGTTIFFTGFPLQATDPVTSIGALAGFAADGGYSTLLIDKNAWPGASGSPVFLNDGKTIVGMLLRTGTGDAAGVSFGISADKISQVLAEAHKNWSETDKKQ
jgi:hypothetical protein